MIYLNLTKFMRKNESINKDLSQALKDFKENYSDQDLLFYCDIENDYYLSSKGDLMLVFEDEDILSKFKLYIRDLVFDYYDCDLRIWCDVFYNKCYECGEIFSDYDLTGIDGEFYCDDCRDENFFLCERCDTYHPNEEATNVYIDMSSRTELWCEDCVDEHATQCCECGDLYSNDLITTIHGRDYCDGCRYNRYVMCDECGEWFDIDELIYDEDSDRDLCSYCYDRALSGLRSYHDNPTRYYHYAEDEEEHEMLIGTEVETEYGKTNERLRITKEAGDDEYYIYQMRDGSLRSDGIECITQPMSKKFFDQFDFETWMHDLVNAGARSHDAENCGLHVHLSRTWMHTDDYDAQLLLVGRMRQFLADNAECVKRFARRSDEQWCKYTKAFGSKCEKDGMSKEDIESKIKDSVKSDCSRYQAINNNNRATIEFRIFKGTLNPNTYRASVEFCLRVVDYVRTHADETLSWEEFISYKELPQSMETYMHQRNFKF